MIQSSTATNQQKTSVWLPTPGSRSKHGGKGTYPWVSLFFLPVEKVRRRSHKSLTFCAFTLVVLPTWYVLKIYSWKQAVSLPIFDTFKWRFFTTSSWEETCTWPTIYDGRFFLPRTGPKLRFFLVLRNCCGQWSDRRQRQSLALSCILKSWRFLFCNKPRGEGMNSISMPWLISSSKIARCWFSQGMTNANRLNGTWSFVLTMTRQSARLDLKAVHSHRRW